MTHVLCLHLLTYHVFWKINECSFLSYNDEFRLYRLNVEEPKAWFVIISSHQRILFFIRPLNKPLTVLIETSHGCHPLNKDSHFAANLALITSAKPQSIESRAEMIRNCITLLLHITTVPNQTLMINYDRVAGQVEINEIMWWWWWL